MTGVSQATVSLVLNNRTGDDVRIAPETRQRVLDAIRATGYVADPVARRLVSGRNRILGVFTYEPVFPSTAADFYHPFLVGIEQRAEQLGCDLLLFTSSSQLAGDGGAGRRRIFHADSRIGIADGTILLGRRVDRDDLVRLVGEGHAFVSVGRRDDAGGPVPYVGADYPAAVAALVERAGELGHARIGYLGTGGPAESHADRLRGFRPTGAGGTGQYRVHLPPPAREWPAAIERERLTAVFLEEHADAAALVVAARARGWSVPGDLSVVALGEPGAAGPLDDALTRLRIPRREMGWQAVEQLTAAIEGGAEPAVQRLLPCTVYAGSTFGPRRDRP
ncbi:LacI family DNA-binding transcriptional regulator [Dactylosporangium aurantiacum]|uniref:LacI family DNA-binding transcriptional regulator n=2 Tax=Dactylosporangium aurantiacum TaxID=35754 RepID=A0A9Q9IPR1_9ACTN|nr:LacI family DNA-binding transcriptional regulator [Dactylosporangium aurantiacum]